MDYKELLEKYTVLLEAVARLTEENQRLKDRLGISSPVSFPECSPTILPDEDVPCGEAPDQAPLPDIHHASDSISKIRLFMSLFKGREDVYARRWENKTKGTSGYAPVCLNQWRDGVCAKPKIPCAKCSHKAYAVLDENVIEHHLRGNLIAGIFPMLADETCWFLAMDFDEGDWRGDIATVCSVCDEFAIPLAVERSRSGQGGHVWFFFEEQIPAALARKFGTALLTCSMNRRHEIQFKSYDRLFPSQDILPKEGIGNLIALPLQKAAREKGNSEFIDENFESYTDQWAFLSGLKKLSEDRVHHLISELAPGHELGVLTIAEEDTEGPKPWEPPPPKIGLQKTDFPEHMEIVRANMLFIPKAHISQRALNRLKRLASFKNPMFYKQQAMRLPTYAFPRVITCAEETEDFLCLPRGCEPELSDELLQIGIAVRLIDKTNSGKHINVAFNGELREEQDLALEHLLPHEIGILSGTTAFGKTVVAIRVIAERKVNTLILVDKVALLSQWKEKLAQFLTIHERLPEPDPATAKRRGRKKQISPVGQMGAGKNAPSGIVDIAVMQSLSRHGEVKDYVRNYGMIIADECHHASAFSYENILKTATAKYIYGLTATPTRKDGHHPILFMHCGPIRYRDDAKKQAEKRPFDHYILPRFTALRIPLDRDEKEVSIQDLYGEIVNNEMRNQQIVDDVVDNYRRGRNCLVLSLRTAHVALLAGKIRQEIPNVVMLTGGLGVKATRELFQRIAETPEDKHLILVATGHFIGEGFDEPRLDTLFLTMPISWKGTLQQYAGRLHRLFQNKKEVRIYDYVDIQVKMLERMYQKRLNGYASMGYKAKGEDILSAPVDIIFDKNNFLPVFQQDLVGAKKEIIIVSPFIRKRRAAQMIQHLQPALEQQVRVIVVTRPVADFKPEDQPALENALDLLKAHQIHVVFKFNIHQKFAIMDQKIVWYGSINLFSYGNAQESMMRIESANIAHELTKSI